jgi:hypothetical protein
MVWEVGSTMGYMQPGGTVLAVMAIPPLEVPSWAPLDNLASGTEVAGGMEEQADAMIQDVS